MCRFARTIASVLVVIVLCANAHGQTAGQAPGPTAGADGQIAKLGKPLHKRGYAEIPLTLNKTGLLDVQVQVEGQPMLLVLDTGANNPNLDRASAKRANLAIKEIEEKTAALGGAVPAAVAKISRFSVGQIESTSETYVVDMAPVNAWRKEKGDPPCDGALGGSYLKHFSAVIDYAGLKLYLLDPAEKAKRLTKKLIKAGYVETPIELNKNGLLDVKVEVDSQAMLLFLDTGYTTFASIERTSTERAKLNVTESDGKSSALGGGLAVGRTQIARLTVAGLTKATDAQVVDFSPTNTTRKANGALPCDGVLGGRFFQHYSAVIDYAHEKLYLLTPAAN